MSDGIFLLLTLLTVVVSSIIGSIAGLVFHAVVSDWWARRREKLEERAVLDLRLREMEQIAKQPRDRGESLANAWGKVWSNEFLQQQEKMAAATDYHAPLTKDLIALEHLVNHRHDLSKQEFPWQPWPDVSIRTKRTPEGVYYFRFDVASQRRVLEIDGRPAAERDAELHTEMRKQAKMHNFGRLYGSRVNLTTDYLGL